MVICYILLIKLMTTSSVIMLNEIPNNTYLTLGNIIINGDFQYPIVPANSYNYAFGSLGIDSWYSTNLIKQYEICSIFNSISIKTYCKIGTVNLTCPNQGIMLDSKLFNQNYTYNLNLQQGIYLIQFKWGVTVVNNLDGFILYLDNMTIMKKLATSCGFKLEQQYIKVTSGSYKLLFQSIGTADSIGITLSQVSVFPLVIKNEIKNTDYFSILNQSTNQKIILIKSAYLPQGQASTYCIQAFLTNNGISRIILSYYIELTHIILYSFHRQNYTSSVRAFLTVLSELQSIKNELIGHQIQTQIGINYSQIDNSQSRQYSFMNNLSIAFPTSSKSELMNLIFNDFVIVLFLFLLFKGIFYLLFRWKISLFFRAYFFNGYFILMLFDSKIEQLTFHFLTHLLNMGVLDFSSKINSISFIFYYFLITIFTISSSFLFAWHYKRQSKYVLEQVKNSLKCFYFLILNKYLFNIFLGIFHRLLIYLPMFQTIMLMITEILFLIILMYGFILKWYEQKMRFITQFILSTLRIFFLIGNLFVLSDINHIQLLDDLNYYLFLSYFVIYMVSGIIIFLYKFFKTLRYLVKDRNQIRDSSSFNKYLRYLFKDIFIKRKPKNKKARFDSKIIVQVIPEKNSKTVEPNNQICEIKQQFTSKKQSIKSKKRLFGRINTRLVVKDTYKQNNLINFKLQFIQKCNKNEKKGQFSNLSKRSTTIKSFTQSKDRKKQNEF